MPSRHHLGIPEEALPLCTFYLYASIGGYGTSLFLGLSPLYLSTRIGTN